MYECVYECTCVHTRFVNVCMCVHVSVPLCMNVCMSVHMYIHVL